METTTIAFFCTWSFQMISVKHVDVCCDAVISCGDERFLLPPGRYAVVRAVLRAWLWINTTMESSSESQQEPEKTLVSQRHIRSPRHHAWERQRCLSSSHVLKIHDNRHGSTMTTRDPNKAQIGLKGLSACLKGRYRDLANLGDWGKMILEGCG